MMVLYRIAKSSREGIDPPPAPGQRGPVLREPSEEEAVAVAIDGLGELYKACKY